MNKDRFFYLRIVAIIVLICGTLAVPARALDVTVINDVPPGHPRLKYALQIEEEVAKASGGSINPKAYRL